MSQNFHKSCYTSRSSGYKYRTLSTNTGDRKRRDSKDDNTVDKVFRDIRREISTRIDKEIDKTSHSREMIYDKFGKIDAKISAMLELQDNVLAMRQALNNAETTLHDMAEKIQKIEEFTSERTSLRSRRSSQWPRSPVAGERHGRELMDQEMAVMLIQ